MEYEREMDDLLLGVPITRDLPCLIEGAALSKAGAEKKEIEGTGLTVVGIHIVAPGQPLHYFVKLPQGKASFEARGKLEALGYNVRQRIRERDLLFFVTKTVTESKGWTD